MLFLKSGWEGLGKFDFDGEALLDMPEAQKIYQETGIALVKIGEEISHKLAHRPGRYYIKEIIRPKYAYPQKEEKGIIVADLPDSLLSKCRAHESFLAEIITKKFAGHLPLYRTAEIIGREGINISRKLLSQWVVRCGMTLKPLYEIMLQYVLSNLSKIHLKDQNRNKKVLQNNKLQTFLQNSSP